MGTAGRMQSCSSLTPKCKNVSINKTHYSFLLNSVAAPVDAATAPINIDGTPSMKMRGAAIKQVILAVADEEADRVLWWKS